ncbi:MAG: hypothetical protein JJU05_11765 [Verrucomicrobia bacterium]|nr:hypothetical protein [Verrucomicrobiota bacterium]MCH8528058.1 hypothetical protein [Kiritimatiellia bacterium]
MTWLLYGACSTFEEILTAFGMRWGKEEQDKNRNLLQKEAKGARHVRCFLDGMNWINGIVQGDGGGGNVRVVPWSALANVMSYTLLRRGLRTMPGDNSGHSARDKNPKKPQFNSSTIRIGIG